MNSRRPLGCICVYFLVVFISRKMATMEVDGDGEDRSVKLNPALDVDLDEIDDNEFDIPRVDKPPTLESILNAPDEDLPIADNYIVDGTLQVGDTPTYYTTLLYTWCTTGVANFRSRKFRTLQSLPLHYSFPFSTTLPFSLHSRSPFSPLSLLFHPLKEGKGNRKA